LVIIDELALYIQHGVVWHVLVTNYLFTGAEKGHFLKWKC